MCVRAGGGGGGGGNGGVKFARGYSDRRVAFTASVLDSVIPPDPAWHRVDAQ